MKRIFKNLLVSVMVLMVFTTAFSGCEKNKNQQTEDIADTTSTETTEATTAPIVESNFKSSLLNSDSELPENVPSSVVKFEVGQGSSNSFIFKNWYDNLDFNIPEGNKEYKGEDIPWSKYYNIYTEGNNKYFISGFNKVQIDSDGNISATDQRDLRTESEGYKYYVRDNEQKGYMQTCLSEFNSMLQDCNGVQPDNLEEREIYLETSGTKIPNGNVCVNNIKSSYKVYNMMIPYVAVYDLFPELMSFSVENGNNIVTLHTANGDQKYAINTYGGSYLAIARPDGSSLMIDSFEIYNDNVYLPADIIEYVFGWQVEIYEGFINIITDEKDIVTEDSIIGKLDLVSIPDVIGTKDPMDLEEGTQLTFDEVLPYITEEEYESFTKKVPENPKASQEAIDGLQAWLDAPKYFTVSDWGHISCPSLIPYDEITIDNIDQAFPNLKNSIGTMPYTPFDLIYQGVYDGDPNSKQVAFEAVVEYNINGQNAVKRNTNTDAEQEEYLNALKDRAKRISDAAENFEDVT